MWWVLSTTINNTKMEEQQNVDTMVAPGSTELESKPKLTTKQTKTAIATAVKNKNITKQQSIQLLRALGMKRDGSTKSTISKKDKKMKSKIQKNARKQNRK